MSCDEEERGPADSNLHEQHLPPTTAHEHERIGGQTGSCKYRQRNSLLRHSACSLEYVVIKFYIKM